MDAELCDVVIAALEEARTPGCAIGLATPNGTWLKGFGIANVETGVRFGTTTRIPIASMTKPYTATAIMALCETGRVELDAPVRRYLPEFRVADRDASERVTIRHLLQHTAGWPGDRADMKDPGLERGSDALATAVASFAGLPQVTAPGELWSYSNSAYMVAGRILETVCRIPFESALQRLVLAPLALRDSTFFVEQAVAHPLAVGHQPARGDDLEVVRWPWACDRATNPAGGLISTVADQLAWARWWAGHDASAAGAPVNATTRDLMLRDTVPAGCMCDEMGMGWAVDVIDGARIGHHEGSLWGIQTQSLFVHEARLALVTLTNGAGGLLANRRIRDHVLGSILGLRPPALDTRALPADRLAEYAGRYRQLAIGHERWLDVHVVNGGLRFDVPGEDDGDDPQPVNTGFSDDDTVVVVEGPLQGLRGEFLRGGDGRIRGVRFGARFALAAGSQPERRN